MKKSLASCGDMSAAIAPSQSWARATCRLRPGKRAHTRSCALQFPTGDKTPAPAAQNRELPGVLPADHRNEQALQRSALDRVPARAKHNARLDRLESLEQAIDYARRTIANVRADPDRG